MELIIDFVENNKSKIVVLQQKFFKEDNVYYPLFKVVDMYFWNEGFKKEILNE